MCGIYGRVGPVDSFNIIKKLSYLEYRGYDSCGIAYIFNNRPFLFKNVGNTKHLYSIIPNNVVDVAIAHTRWATHGEVSKLNAHPHTTIKERFYVVHNGMIDNYKEIEKKYKFKLLTKTDSEIIPHLLDYYFSLGLKMIDVLKLLIQILNGTYAIIILDKLDSNKLYFIKNLSPLLIATSGSIVEISSDQISFEARSNVTVLNDYNYGFIEKSNYYIYSDKRCEYWHTFYKSESNLSYKSEHFMYDEIKYQSIMIKNIFIYYEKNYQPLNDLLMNTKDIVFVGSGSSYYASIILKNYYEEILKKRINVVLANEIKSFKILNKDTTFIFFSQSGETADLLDAILYLNNKYKIISLCNKINSQLGYKSNITYPLLAEDENAVASTKAFLAMVYVGRLLINKKELCNYKEYIKDIEIVYNNWQLIHQLAKKIYKANFIFFIGKGEDYNLCLEASLKMRELSYIHSFAFPSGELKHGSISLVDKNSVAIAIISNESNYKYVRNNLVEIDSRGGKCFIITNTIYDGFVKLNVSYIGLIVVMQILAYEVAKLLNRNIDQPRNLAKSVTVL